MLPGRTVKGALSLTQRRLVSSALLVSGPLLWHIKPVVVIVMAGALHPLLHACLLRKRDPNVSEIT